MEGNPTMGRLAALAEVTNLLKLEDGRRCRETERLAQQKLMRLRKSVRELIGRCESGRGGIACPIVGRGRALSAPWVPYGRHAWHQWAVPITFVAGAFDTGIGSPVTLDSSIALRPSTVHA